MAAARMPRFPGDQRRETGVHTAGGWDAVPPAHPRPHVENYGKRGGFIRTRISQAATPSRAQAGLTAVSIFNTGDGRVRRTDGHLQDCVGAAPEQVCEGAHPTPGDSEHGWGGTAPSLRGRDTQARPARKGAQSQWALLPLVFYFLSEQSTI